MTRKTTTAMIVTTTAFTLAVTGCKDEPREAKERSDAASEPQKTSDPGATAGTPTAGDPVAPILASVNAFNAGDLDAAARSFADDVRYTVVAETDTTTGTQALRSEWKELRDAFPDLKVAVKRIVIDEHRVAVHLVSHGTHRGEYMGHAPTGKEVGAELLYLLSRPDSNEGEFTALTVYANTAAYLSQIGAAPSGMEPVPVPSMPTGEPQVIRGKATTANVEVVKAWYAAIEDGKATQKIDELLASDVVHHMATEGETERGHESVSKSIDELTKAVSDINLSAVEYQSIGDWVLTRGKWSGKHVGDAGNTKASYARVSVDFVELLRVEDGKLAEAWEFYNPVQLMAQLGDLDAPDEEPKPPAP